MSKIITTKLKYVRLSKGVSIQEISEKVEVNQSRYKKWEDGTATPPRLKKEILGEYLNVSYKKLFTKFYVESSLIADLEKRMGSREEQSNDRVQIPWCKAERMKQGITQTELSRILELGSGWLSAFELKKGMPLEKNQIIENKLSTYFGVPVEKLLGNIEMSKEAQKQFISNISSVNRKKKSESDKLSTNIKEIEWDIDEMSGSEVRDFSKRIAIQNRTYEEETERLKKQIVEIQAINSDESSYKNKYEKLLAESESKSKIEQLVRELFKELSLEL
jgi:transcriptional regulator with XRE-family HTH domain